MGCKHCGIVAAVVIAALVYTFYAPLPSDAVEPWGQMFFRALFRIPGLVCKILGPFGFDCINITRFILEALPPIPIDDGVKVTAAKFDGVDVHIYVPNNAEDNGPGMIYLHGGGWQLCSLDMYDPTVRLMAKTSGFVTISIGYRQAPEHPFPAAFDDSVAATVYFLKNAKQYGVDPARVGIAGDSAGGNLAAAVNLKLSNAKLRPMLQTLIYPAMQALDMDLPSFRTYNDDTGPYFLTRTLMIKFWLIYGAGNDEYLSYFLANNHTSDQLKKSKYFGYIDRNKLPNKYLSDMDKSPSFPTGNDKVFSKISKWLLNPYFAPLMASDEELKKLPPTQILTVEYDCLRDDGFLFAKRLQDLNVEVQHTHFDGLMHAHLNFVFLESTANSVNEMVQFWYQQMFDEEQLLKKYTERSKTIKMPKS